MSASVNRMASPARAGTACKGGLSSGWPPQGLGKLLLCAPGITAKQPSSGPQSSIGKTAFVSVDTICPCRAAVILAFGEDGRAVHVHPRVTPAPSIDRVRVV